MNALYCYLKNSDLVEKTLRDYELYVLECFKNKFIKLLYKKSKIHKN